MPAKKPAPRSTAKKTVERNAKAESAPSPRRRSVAIKNASGKRAPSAESGVQPGNPCPFLRALVEAKAISPQRESLAHLSEVVTRAMGVALPSELAVRPAVALIAEVANGLDPLSLLKTFARGVRIDHLRDGPLDKHGVGSRILSEASQVDMKELDRLDQFAVDKVSERGKVERGLGARELTKFMNANYARAKEKRRLVDRQMMEGEWPVLLRVMGKRSAKTPDGKAGDRYLSVTEVRTLFIKRQLPKRVASRLSVSR